jgi:hypothetical protein
VRVVMLGHMLRTRICRACICVHCIVQFRFIMHMQFYRVFEIKVVTMCWVLTQCHTLMGVCVLTPLSSYGTPWDTVSRVIILCWLTRCRHTLKLNDTVWRLTQCLSVLAVSATQYRVSCAWYTNYVLYDSLFCLDCEQWFRTRVIGNIYMHLTVDCNIVCIFNGVHISCTTWSFSFVVYSCFD